MHPDPDSTAAFRAKDDCTLLRIENASVCIPVLDSDARSIKKSALAAISGDRVSVSGNGFTVHALREISLAIKRGERIGLMGPNGSGKSTLLRLMAGIYPPTLGTVSWQGSSKTLLNIGIGLDFDATGYENILLKCLLDGMSPARAKALRDEIADFSGLGSFIHLPVRTYSTGMLLRLAFSIATAEPADIILMDEWLAVGDSEFGHRAQLRLQHVVQNSGILVLASQSEALLRAHCNRLIELDSGRIVSDHALP